MALYHVFSEVENRNTGVPMSGVIVKAFFRGTNSIAPIFADENGTPFSPANQTETDADGMYSFYVGAGEYDLHLLVGTSTIKVIENFTTGLAGPTGPANSTYESTFDLKLADVTNLSAILTENGKAGTFVLRNTVDFTAEIAADTDEKNYIVSTAVPENVWVRASILPEGASFVGMADGGTVEEAVTSKASAAALGVSGAANDMGAFSGSIISDNVSAKSALQELETALESTSGSAAEKANATAVGVNPTDTDMGSFAGSIIPDNQTAKESLQALETATEAKAAAAAIGITGAATDMGASPGSILSDNGTAKDWFQESEAAIEDVRDFSHATSYPNGTISKAAQQYVSIKDAPFSAVGDGVADDTAAWNAFQAAEGLKFVPRGRYLVDGTVRRIDRGVYGNGVFDNISRFTWAHGDRQRDSIISHGRDIIAYDANNPSTATALSPTIRTQTKVSYNSNPTGSDNTLFVRVAGAYHETVGTGTVVNGSDGSVGNFTTFGAVADNRFAGLFGMTAISGRVYDAKESEVPGITTHGASKSLSGYFPFERRSKYESGGYMLGLETYCFWNADETDAIPYTNNDSHAFTSFVVGYHCTAAGVSAPITDGILFDSTSGANHGFYNAINIGGSSMKVDNVTAGATGTVGINMASWNTSYGDIGIKFRNANRHLHFVSGAKIRSGTTRFLNDAGAAEVHIEAASEQIPTLRFKTGATTAANPATTEVGAIYANSTAAIFRSAGGSVQLHADTTVYEANTARFSPASADDNLKALGASTRRWSTVYAGTGTINTSDAREKTEISPITDEVLDAWGDVNLVAFRWIESVAAKGDAARVHYGLIAQQVKQAFEARGLDATRYGLLCYDEWEAQPERVDVLRTPTKPPVYEQILVTPAYMHSVEKVTSPAEHDENGNVIKEAVMETQEVEVEATYRDGEMLAPEEFIEERVVTPSVPAGDRWGIRADQCLFLEAAYQRRRADRVEARVAALEAAA